MAEFFAMGGHGAYIWPVYGLAFFLMVALFVHSIISWRRNEAELALLKTLKSQGKTVTSKEGSAL